ncbi:oxidized low-density lipoprotein receptor 1 isoform X2 [Phycodurus eques]|uniref:oxidized low-density lipoprotein receptor 1 isoform X2 n=1 Tax=Phycodurus eques TaxID=693459 RepID=UPI002ACDA0A7|nr:oxidized low-density lipoprotein receptor 1 isoform X2 [Phycodurus eques]
MAEELNYVTVKFNSHQLPNNAVVYEDVRSKLDTWAEQRVTQEKCGEVEEIYDDVRTKELPCSLPHMFQENVSKVSHHIPATLAVATLGVLCVILISVIIALTLHLNVVTAEQRRQNVNLTAQNEHVRAELELLRERAQELSWERDQLNWTMGMVLQYDNFPVITYCPQRVLSLCKPCMDDWLLFGSKCYLFVHSPYYSGWMDWQDSVDDCRRKNAHLLLIESQEEQEFITNHTRYYQDDKHGYWIGLNKTELSENWKWNDGRNLTLAFWRDETYYIRNRCALMSKSLTSTSLDNWRRVYCDMKNRFICETNVFTKLDLH